MRCAVGDLVVVVCAFGWPDAIGRLGRIVGISNIPGFDWLVDLPHFPGPSPDKPWHSPDNYLRPIRDSDGQDETLTWKEREIA